MKPKRRPTKTTDLYSSAQFLELKKDWYEKLEAAGFTDIENANGTFKDADEDAQAKKTLVRAPDRAEALAEYYTEAERGLASLVFDSWPERRIWIHHCAGLSVREVAAEMDVAKIRVERTLTKYRKRLGIVRPR